MRGDAKNTARQKPWSPPSKREIERNRALCRRKGHLLHSYDQNWGGQTRHHSCTRRGCGFHAEVTPRPFTVPGSSWKALHKITPEDRRYYDAHPAAMIVPAKPEAVWPRKEPRQWTPEMAESLGLILVRPGAKLERRLSSARLDAARARREERRNPKTKRRKRA